MKRGLLLLFVLTGCASSGIDLTRDRATFDLNCPKDQISVEKLEGPLGDVGSVFGARGCGKRASYVQKQAQNVLLNSPIQEDK
jgi:hypothetical protein